MLCEECKWCNSSSSCSVFHPPFLVHCSSPSYSLCSFLRPLFFVQCSSPLLCVVFTLYSLCIVFPLHTLCAVFFALCSVCSVLPRSLCSVLDPLFFVQCSLPLIICALFFTLVFSVQCFSTLYCFFLFRSYIVLSDCSQLPTANVLCSVVYDGFNSVISWMLRPPLFHVSQAEHSIISVSLTLEIISDVLLYFHSSPFLSTGWLFCAEVSEQHILRWWSFYGGWLFLSL